ncbi:MAG: tRNA glutamyl-Q(34) synthetase GluQRS [Betaproteobacteria bacterium]|nr:tRNA glutamyl-Q(34) synthetase GluQRS [Betaproteobacteria bacterium]MDE2056018.1 tRNA glutamyl-Q(34) synthetase GluQRS [Betaproteobacteria bacterium]
MKKNSLRYRGRFAPSPTGELHLGSLVCALASYIEAKQNKGVWLIRIEDIDKERCRDHFATTIINKLLEYGLESDEPVVYQSKRLNIYYDAIEQLKIKNLLYPCVCNRENRKKYRNIDCPCLVNPIKHTNQCAWRLLTNNEACSFNEVNHRHSKILSKEDRINIIRRDGLISYDLAVCVDDATQNITHIVRGEDLFNHTFVQRFIQESLRYHKPIYRHLPLVLDDNGEKLSKQNLAKPIDVSFDCLTLALTHLGIYKPQIYFGSTIQSSIQNIIKSTLIYKLNEFD